MASAMWKRASLEEQSASAGGRAAAGGVQVKESTQAQAGSLKLIA
jgi:hypothetical protein